jgi:hypothetical protein
MTESDSPISSLRTRGKARVVVIIIAAIIVPILIAEMFVLNGEEIFRAGGYEEEYPIHIKRLDEEHMLSIRTRRKKRLEVTIFAPDGSELVHVNERASHRRHYIPFTPKVAGVYKIALAKSTLFSTGDGSKVRVKVDVTVGDRRFFTPLLYNLGF